MFKFGKNTTDEMLLSMKDNLKNITFRARGGQNIKLEWNPSLGLEFGQYIKMEDGNVIALGVGKGTSEDSNHDVLYMLKNGDQGICYWDGIQSLKNNEYSFDKLPALSPNQIFSLLKKCSDIEEILTNPNIPDDTSQKDDESLLLIKNNLKNITFRARGGQNIKLEWDPSIGVDFCQYVQVDQTYAIVLGVGKNEEAVYFYIDGQEGISYWSAITSGEPLLENETYSISKLQSYSSGQIISLLKSFSDCQRVLGNSNINDDVTSTPNVSKEEIDVSTIKTESPVKISPKAKPTELRRKVHGMFLPVEQTEPNSDSYKTLSPWG